MRLSEDNGVSSSLYITVFGARAGLCWVSFDMLLQALY